MKASQAARRGPGRTARTLLALFLVGLCSRAYGDYNQSLKAGTGGWVEVLEGRASAPEQYRVGVVVAADWISRHLHLRLSQAFGLLDLASSLLALLLLYGRVERTAVFRRGSEALQWFGAAAFLALSVYALDWASWYQRVTTLPITLLVTLPVVSLTPGAHTGAHAGRGVAFLRAAAFLTAIVLLSLVRTDAAVAVSAGLFVAAALRLGGPLALGCGALLATSATGALLAAGIQLYLARVRYPQASYGAVPIFMLRHDWWRVTMWAACLIFAAPFLWTVRQALRRRYAGEGAGAATLLAGSAYMALWIALGRLDEVRIFLPLALLTTPVTVELAMLALAGTAHDPSPAGS